MRLLPIPLLAWLAPAAVFAQPVQEAPIVQAQPAPPPVYAQPAPAPVYAPPGPGYAMQPPPQYVMGPRTLPFEEGEAIPPGYTPRQKARTGLIIGGSVTLGVAYLFSLMAFVIDDSVCSEPDFGGSSGDSCSSDLWPLSIPVAGPWLTLGTTDGAQDGLMILILDGVAQVGGVAMLALGISSKKTVLVRNDLAEVHVAPLVTAGGIHGVALGGTF